MPLYTSRDLTVCFCGMSVYTSGDLIVCFSGMSVYTSKAVSVAYAIETGQHTLLKMIWFVSVECQHTLQGVFWSLALVCQFTLSSLQISKILIPYLWYFPFMQSWKSMCSKKAQTASAITNTLSGVSTLWNFVKTLYSSAVSWIVDHSLVDYWWQSYSPVIVTLWE
jgi:hypothetical protein